MEICVAWNWYEYLVWNRNFAWKECVICLVRHMPQQPFQDHPSEHPGSWAKPWSADEMLDGQRQRMDVLAHATTAHDGLSLNGTGRGSLLNHPSAPADEQ